MGEKAEVIRLVVTLIRKRDGRLEKFDVNRPGECIYKAIEALGGKDRKMAEELGAEVVRIVNEKFTDENPPDVEQVQDIIEEVLVNHGHYRVAKAYMLYRARHEELRAKRSTFTDVTEFVDGYLKRSDWRISENANIDFSMSSLMFHTTTSVMARWLLDKYYPPECIPPEEIVAGHYAPISSYKVGDTCLGFSGENRIAKVFVRPYRGKLTIIRATGMLPLKLTPEHPILVCEGSILHWDGKKPIMRVKFGNLRWKPASSVVPKRFYADGDYLVIPRIKGRISIRTLDLMSFVRDERGIKLLKRRGIPLEIPLNNDVAWLLGLFCAEGSRGSSSQDNAVFCFGEHEKILAKRVKEVIRGLGFSAQIRKIKNGLIVSINSLIFSRGIWSWCGGSMGRCPRAHEKRVPEFILYHTDEEILRSFLKGYLEGNGCCYPEKSYVRKYGPRVKASTVSKVLALQLQLLGARLGLHICICEEKRRGILPNGCPYEGTIYELHFSPKRSWARVFENYILVQVRSIEEADYDGSVYNLETEDKTYLVNNIVVHNCSDAHIDGDIHIHDLGQGAVGYCAGWSLSQFLLEGFGGVPRKVNSKPPKHLDTALIQLVNLIGCLQQEWAGAQALNSFDTLLAPFVWSDKLSYREVKQLMQSFIFNLNVASRWGGQSPFTNVSFDLTCPEDLASQPAIVGGKPLDKTYEEFEEEAEMINRAFIEILSEGDASGAPFTFPIPTYSLTKDFEWDGDISSELFKMTAKYGLPYFQNFIKSDLKPSDIRSMCCHLRLDLKELRRNITGGLFGSGDSTGSVGVVTINMPRLGYLSKGDDDEFFRRLEYMMQLAKRTLEHKRELVQKNIDSGLLPYTKRYLGSLRNHFSTIGLVGMHEALCLKGDTIVAGDYKEIATYEGEKCLGVSGIVDIKKFYSRPYSGKMIRIKACGMLPTDITPEHSVLVSEGKLRHIKNRKKGEDTNRIVFSELKWKTAQELIVKKRFTKGDYLVVPRIKAEIDVDKIDLSEFLRKRGNKKSIRSFPINKDTAWLLGLYVAEGHSCPALKNQTQIAVINLGPTEEDLAQRAINILKNIGVKASIQRPPSRSSIGVQFYGPLARALPVWCGKGAKNKQIPSFILYHKDASLSEAFLNGCLEGDGYVYHFKIRGHNPRAEILTTSKKLALQLQLLCARLGFFASINRRKQKTGQEIFDVGYPVNRKNKYAKVFQDYILTPIREINEIWYNDEVVYNLETSDNTYVANNFVVHNCNFGIEEGIIGEEGRKFAILTLKFMLKLCAEFQEETGNLYNLEATPAEGTSYRLAKIDKGKFPDIITSGKDVPYYTNSTCLPVNQTKLNFVEALRHQEELQSLYTGGTVYHLFLGEAISSGGGCKELVKRISTNFKIPYFTITPTFSICIDHGYLRGEHFSCPNCGKKTDVYSRIVGYYRPVGNWNVGKQEEFRERLRLKESILNELE